MIHCCFSRHNDRDLIFVIRLNFMKILGLEKYLELYDVCTLITFTCAVINSRDLISWLTQALKASNGIITYLTTVIATSALINIYTIFRANKNVICIMSGHAACWTNR